jgi:hypothetical protein
MRRNPLRERLNAGKPTVGTTSYGLAHLVELIQPFKLYDYVEFTAYALHMHDLDTRPLVRAHELSA